MQKFWVRIRYVDGPMRIDQSKSGSDRNQRRVRAQRVISTILFVGLISFYFSAWRAVRAPLTDFLPMYAAARLMQANQNPYDLKAQCKVESAVRTDLCMPFNHTPVLLPLVSFITTDDYHASYTRWCLLLVLVLAVTVFPAYRLSKNLDASLQAILFLPILISVTQGQDTAFMLSGIFIWALLLKAKRDFWAGVALTLTMIKPQIALLFGVPMAFSRPRAFLGFVVGGVLAVAFSFSLVDSEGFKGLIEIVRLSSRGQTLGVNHADMYSAVGIFARAGLSPYWVWPVFVAALFVLGWMWRRYGTSIHAISLGIIVITIAAPHLLFHDIAPLAIPVYLIHPFAPAAGSLLLLLSRTLGFPHLGAYLLMALLAGYHANELRKLRLATI
jgi:hypothetical protein